MEKPDPTYQEENLNELIKPYTRRWPWFVVGLILALVVAVVYLRYTKVQYETRAAIIVKDSRETSLAGELAPFSQLGLFNRVNQQKLQNEIAIFRSRRILGKVIDQLELNWKYEAEGRLISSELYPDSPIEVAWDSIAADRAVSIPQFKITPVSDQTFELNVGNEVTSNQFGETVRIQGNPMVVNKTAFFDNDRDIDRTLVVTYNSTEALILYYQKQLQIELEDKNSNIVSIALNSAKPPKAEAFISELIEQYNQDAAQDEKEIARKTAQFIDDRLALISSDLDSVELDKEEFKTDNRLTNLEAESALVLQTATEFSNQQVDYTTRIQVVEYLLNYLQQNEKDELLPANLGLEGGDINSLISDYNKLLLDRKRLATNSTGANPVIVNIDRQLEGLRESIVESLENQRKSLELALNQLSRQEGRFNNRLSQVPAQERVFRGIVRQQEIKEQLYIFLLTQREQAVIRIAAATNKVKLVDGAYTDTTPVAPKRPVFYLGAGLLGLLIPFLMIYGGSLLNNKVQSRKDIEKELKELSVVGEIPLIRKTDKQFVQLNDRGVLAESFRILRTNLEYLFVNRENSRKSHAILVTSSIQGEGKTLMAFNLALTYSYTGKKVALVGADIRNPQLQRYLPDESTKSTGLTNYIVDDSLQLQEVIAQSKFGNLDIVLSGATPPNPAEMLMHERVGQLFDQLREKYDYIIIDSAPCLLVTDTLLINKYADITLYAVKAGHTDKRLLEYPRETVADGRLKNLALVLNAVKMNNFGYGNKYGYSYSREKPSWRDRLFGRL